MSLFLLTTGVFALAFAGLAVGVMLTKDKELQGSCGGPDANPDCCQTCPDAELCESVGDLGLDVPEVEERPVAPGLQQAPEA